MITNYKVYTTTDLADVLISNTIFNDYQLWGWGTGADGRLGDNTTAGKSSPVQTVTAGATWRTGSAGGAHTGAIKTDGTLWLWGANIAGQLGDNTTTSKSSPVQTISGGSVWRQISTSNGNHSAAIRNDGSLWLWGNGTSGQLGNGNTSRSSPIQTVTGGSNWLQVSAGSSFTGAIKTDGTLWLWGINVTNGNLGDGTTVSKSSPVQTVAGGNNWAQVSCGNIHAAAVKTDGTLWLWGANTNGQLGDGTQTSTSSPIQTVTGGSNWAQVACGLNFTVALKTDGTLWLWGANIAGQLGNNTNTDTSSPVQTVAGGSNWAYVAAGAGGQHVAAVKTDGTLWLWGLGTSGQLGDNTQVSKSSPVQTVAGGSTWRTVWLGDTHTFAIKT